MPDPSDMRLLALLREQRRVERRRDALPRETAAWLLANARLDAVNGAIMRAAMSLDASSPGHAAIQLDSHPDGDAVFRDSVMRCVRQALRARTIDRLAERATGRLAIADEQMRRATGAIAEAQARLRDAYPQATLSVAPGQSPNPLRIRADRDGRVA